MTNFYLVLVGCSFAIVANSLPTFDISFDNQNINSGQADLNTLVLVNVLFRHGNRTPGLNELYPQDPYLNFSYWPFENGQLTKAGKRREYSIGESLRVRYNRFLGENYYPSMLDSRSTDYNRTKMSLDLVHASLFQPRGIEKWKFGLNWQPIPYNYAPTDNDKILIGMNCPNYTKLYKEYVQSSGFQEVLSPYREIFNYISENTGLNVTSFQEVYNLYFGLSTEEEWGFILPEWTKSVWPETITNLAIKQYNAETGTKQLTSLVNGYFIQKLIVDAQTKIANLPEKFGRKLYLYSAHENNIAELLVFLNVFSPPHVPTYGSYVIFELHNINNTYGFKLLYQHYTSKGLQQLVLPECTAFCPLDKFIALYKDYIPSEELCGN